MSGYIKPLRRFSEKHEPFRGVFNPALQIGKSLAPDLVPPEIPAAPTIDDAMRARQGTDRMRRRKGVYANIFAGAAAAPTVGKATLGG